MVKKPQDTSCTSIEISTDDDILDEGVTNGIISMISSTREVEYDERADVYLVGEKL